MYSKNLSSKISENKKSEKFTLSQAPTLSLIAQPLLKSRGLFNVIPDRNRRILFVGSFSAAVLLLRIPSIFVLRSTF